MNYYNEYDPKAAAWLRELIKAGEIPPGDVDERSILEISPHELTRYTQQHFFAGIGGWSLALKLAGWPVDRPVRTGSCPCQPFSAAGKQRGTEDERHLWPVFRDLITFGEATATFGEQVASSLGREWLAGIRADLEGLGYAVGAADLCAAGAGAPHIRQRLFWVAHPPAKRHSVRDKPAGAESGRSGPGTEVLRRGKPGGLAHANSDGRAEHEHEPRGRPTTLAPDASERGRPSRGLADTDGGDAGAEGLQRSGQYGQRAEDGGAGGVGESNDAGSQGRDGRGDRPDERSPWSASVALPCTDGKSRRIEPGTFPLAHGISGRVGLLRGYGNAIVPQIAAHFIAAYLEATS